MIGHTIRTTESSRSWATAGWAESIEQNTASIAITRFSLCPQDPAPREASHIILRRIPSSRTSTSRRFLQSKQVERGFVGRVLRTAGHRRFRHPSRRRWDPGPVDHWPGRNSVVGKPVGMTLPPGRSPNAKHDFEVVIAGD